MTPIEDLTRQTETATTTEVRLARPSSTRTISEIVEEAEFMRTRVSVLRDEVEELHANATQLHVDAFDTAIDQAAIELARASTQTLLERMGAQGFSWRDVARLLGVSVPAVQKWRSGGGATPPHHQKVARLVALTMELTTRFMIEDVASWLELPLTPEAPVSAIDLLAADRSDLVLRWAAHTDVQPQEILDDFDPGWRERYASDFEIFTAPDGQPGIRFTDD